MIGCNEGHDFFGSRWQTIEQVVNDLNVEDTTGTGEASRCLFNNVEHRIISCELGVDVHLVRPNTVTKKVRHINAEETAIEGC